MSFQSNLVRKKPFWLTKSVRPASHLLGNQPRVEISLAWESVLIANQPPVCKIGFFAHVATKSRDNTLRNYQSRQDFVRGIGLLTHGNGKTDDPCVESPF